MKIEEELTINWAKVMPSGFVGFEQLGRTIQENLLKDEAKKIGERTAKATEGALVKFGSMDKHLAEISKKTGKGGGFLSDDEGPL